MRLQTTLSITCAAIATFSFNQMTHANVTEFDENRADWFTAVGVVTTIDFTQFPDGTIILDQYSPHGVHFLDGDDNVFLNPGAFPLDDFGLDGNAAIHLVFDEPQLYIAVDYPGGAKFQLFSTGSSFFTSSNFGIGGPGHFAGLISDQLFDEVIITDWAPTQINIDDLHFGVPTPGALPVLALGVLGLSKRRKRKHDGST